jgi:hypothetical protein
MFPHCSRIATLAALGALLTVGSVAAEDPVFTSEFDRARCTFTPTASGGFFPLQPGLSNTLQGEELDGGETVELEVILTVLPVTETVDGVVTRVVEERESQDGELVEVSRNFFALCRETGDVWYFGEDVDIYEEGVVVSHDGAWRAGVAGARAGILVPGSPLVGARFYQELAPGIAEDRSEVLGTGGEASVPAGDFTGVLSVLDTNALSPASPGDLKIYAPGVGLIVDEVMELTETTPPPCVADGTTHCLQQGRFRVRADWRDFQGGSGAAHALLGAAESGEFWFFWPDNTELLVKVLDGCGLAPGAYWVFAAGLTNVEVTLTVEDTATAQQRTYSNALGVPFAPILDTAAFATCP